MTTAPPDPGPTPGMDASDRLDPAVWRVFAVVVAGALLAQLDATIVNVALAPLAQDLHSSLPVIQWVMSGYLLALTLVLPLSGWLVDRIGARALYLWCLGAFTLCSGLCGLAGSAPALIGARVLQGIGGGLLAPMTQMMIARTAGRHMVRVTGYAVLPVLAAPILGPVLAGFILHHASWRWLFLINLPVGVLALGLAAWLLPDDRGETRPRQLDWLGLALLSPGLVLVLYGAEHVTQGLGAMALVAGLGLLGAFLWQAARRGERALIDLRLFRLPVFGQAAITTFLSNGALFTGQMLVPLFLLDGCGRTPGEMGWLLAPLGLGMMVTYPSLGLLTRRFGIRHVSVGGALLASGATLPFLYLAHHGLNLGVLALALGLRGMGQSAVGIPSISAAYAVVERRDLPMATTSLNVVQRLGGPVFTTLCATLLGGRLPAGGAAAPLHGANDAYVWAFALLVALHALTALAARSLPLRLDGPGDSDGATSPER